MSRHNTLNYNFLLTIKNMEYILNHEGRSFFLSLITSLLVLIGQPLAAQTTTLPEQLPRPVLNSNKLNFYQTPLLSI